jgi:hypothetical protein
VDWNDAVEALLGMAGYNNNDEYNKYGLDVTVAEM